MQGHPQTVCACSQAPAWDLQSMNDTRARPRGDSRKLSPQPTTYRRPPENIAKAGWSKHDPPGMQHCGW